MSGALLHWNMETSWGTNICTVGCPGPGKLVSNWWPREKYKLCEDPKVVLSKIWTDS